MKNRFLGLVLSVFLILCMFSVPTFAVENAMSFEGNTEAQVGDTVVVSLNLNKNPGVISLSFDVSYDKEGLLLKGVEDTKLVKGYNSSPYFENVSPYTLFWLDGTATSNNTQTGTVAKLTFEVLKAGKHEIKAKCNVNDTCNFNLDSVNFESATHTIKVDGDDLPEGGDEPPEGDDGDTPGEGGGEPPEGGETPPSGGDVNPPEEPSEPDAPVVPDTPQVLLNKSIDGEVEDEVTFSIDINGNPGIISAKFYVDYDKTALTLVKVENTGLLKVFESSDDYQNIYPYSLFWLEGTAATNNKENGTVAKLTFKVNNPGNHAVKVTCEPKNTCNFLFDEIDFGSATGTVNAVMGERMQVYVDQTDEDYHLTVKVKLMTDTAFVYVAAYSDKGRMVGASLTDADGKVSFEKSLNIDYFKTFLWTADGLPLDMAVITEL